jgi:hypothetical protein
MSLSVYGTSHLSSIGMGINLTAASVVIMYGLQSLYSSFSAHTSSEGLIRTLILTMTAKLRIEHTG